MSILLKTDFLSNQIIDIEVDPYRREIRVGHNRWDITLIYFILIYFILRYCINFTDRFYMRLIFTIFGTIVFSLAIDAKDHAILLGGGAGEKELLGDPFIKDSKAMIQELSKNGYSVSGAFGDSYLKNELLKEIGNDKSDISEFSKKNLKKLLDAYIEKVNRGEIKSGDKVFIQVSTHGAERKSGEVSHGVTYPGMKINDENISLDTLLPLLKRLTSAGVQVAILDLSCFSGASLSLDDSNICVISATTDKVPAHIYARPGSKLPYDSFGQYFWQEVRENKSPQSMEKLFLETREKLYFPSPKIDPYFFSNKININYSMDLPGISTKNHYMLSTLINGVYEGEDKFPRFHRLRCLKTHNPFEEMKISLESISEFLQFNVNDLISRYDKLYEQTSEALRRLYKLEQVNKYGTVHAQGEKKDVGIEQCSHTSYQKMMAALFGQKVGRRIKALCKNMDSKDSKEFVLLNKKVKSGAEELEEVTRKIVSFEKKLYTYLYHQTPPVEDDPCSNFML